MFRQTLLIVALIMSANASAATDPTKPFSSANSAKVNGGYKEKKLVLESIVHGSGVHTAIINGKLMKVGQYIGEFKLVAVNDKSVVLRSEEERKKLYIFSELKAK